MKTSHLKTQLLGLLVAGSAMLMQPVAHAQTKWDWSTEYAPTSIAGRVAAQFAKRVQELSDGKLEVMVHYSAGLGFKSQDHYSAVEDGALPVADTPFNRMNGIYPIFDLQSLPFLQSTLKEAKVLDQIMRPLCNNVMKKNNQFVLFTVPWTPQGFWAKKDIVSKEDLIGLRVRVNDLAAVQTLKAAQADAIQMSWGDTITGLSTGAINAVLTSDDTGLTGKLPESGLTSFSAIGFTVGLQMAHANLEMFESLPTDVQTAVLIAAAEAEHFGWVLARSIEATNAQTMRAQGISVVTDVDPEFRNFLKASAAEAIDNWKKRFGSQADNILAAYQSILAAD